MSRISLSLLLCLLALSSPVFAAAVATGPARVVDGDTLVVHGERIRLFGIDAPEHDQVCRDAKGKRWACGTRATEEMMRLTRGRTVRCTGNGRDRYGRLVARCRVGTRDLGEAMVSGGMAMAYRQYSTLYVGEEKAARAAGRGIWAGSVEAPSQFRREERAEKDAAAAKTPQKAPKGCAIKGNISAHGRIYHLPGQHSYAATRIDTGAGERWFCSEAEARAAGWRKAQD